MWSRDLCIPRFIVSSKRVGSRRVGTFTKRDVKRSFTSSPAPDERNSRRKKRAGIASSWPSPRSDKPPKSLATKRHLRHKKEFRNEVVQHTSRSITGTAATRNSY